MTLNETSLAAIDKLIEFWSTDTAKSVEESREESAAVIEAVFEPVVQDYERRLEMARAILVQIHQGVEGSRGSCVDCDAVWFVADTALTQLGAPSPREGSWDWALAQIKAGKRVIRAELSESIGLENDEFIRAEHDPLCDCFAMSPDDFSATDWRIADGEKP